MNPLRQSIRRQLLAWLLIPLSLLWIIFGVLTYFLAIDLTNSAYDSGLADSARYVVSRLSFQNSKVEFDFPSAAEALFRDDPKDRIYIQVIGPDGKLMKGDANLPSPNIDQLNREAYFRTVIIDGRKVRVAALKWPVPDSNNKYVLLQVGETEVERDQLEKKILITILVPEIITILLAAIAIGFGVRQGLAPLKLVQDAVDRRSQSDLHPLSEDLTPKEVRPLVRAINDLLKRLQRDIEAQRRFVANAAHQLRTPLAGLKTQTQLALRQTTIGEISPALQKIHTSADRCARLVNQLLVLAKVEPGAIDKNNYVVLDLNSIARSATEEVVSDALTKGIDLGFEGTIEPALVLGDALSLHELVFNLVENAVRYTKSGDKVTVRITVDGITHLSVEDNGPGVPVEERERVFERFYRVLGTGAAGSGLGLAIVSEIAAAHGAEVSLSDGPNGVGTIVTVSFATASKARQAVQTVS